MWRRMGVGITTLSFLCAPVVWANQTIGQSGSSPGVIQDVIPAEDASTPQTVPSAMANAAAVINGSASHSSPIPTQPPQPGPRVVYPGHLVTTILQEAQEVIQGELQQLRGQPDEHGKRQQLRRVNEAIQTALETHGGANGARPAFEALRTVRQSVKDAMETVGSGHPVFETLDWIAMTLTDANQGAVRFRLEKVLHVQENHLSALDARWTTQQGTDAMQGVVREALGVLQGQGDSVNGRRVTRGEATQRLTDTIQRLRALKNSVEDNPSMASQRRASRTVEAIGQIIRRLRFVREVIDGTGR